MRKFRINVSGNSYDVEVEEVGSAVYAPAPAAVSAPAPVAAPVAASAVQMAPAESKPAEKAAPAAEGIKISSPMPGTILDVRVKVGDAVKKGDVMMILEAMKMENEIQAPEAGTIAGVYTEKGSSVNAGDLLTVIS